MEGRTRMYLAVLVVVSVIGVALLSVYVSDARDVVDRLLPVLTLVLGYYFGQDSMGVGNQD